jgi:hypothetical protein
MVRTTKPIVLHPSIVAGGTPQRLVVQPDGTPRSQSPIGYFEIWAPSTNTASIKFGVKDQTGTFQYVLLEKGGPVIRHHVPNGCNIDMAELYIDGTTGDVLNIIAYNLRH